MIQVENLSFSYGDQKIVENLTFDISPGKFTSIIGPNGAGKTTLFRLLTKSLPPFQGKVILGDRNLTAVSIKEFSKKAAVISQELQIRFPFTCLEIVMMGRAPFRRRSGQIRKEDLEVVQACMEWTDTLRLKDALITEISGGEKQRVMLAKALAQSPEVLFLDEPTSGLDPVSADRFDHMIETLKSQLNLTVVMVTHDQDSLWRIVDRAAFLGEGKLLALGSPAELYENDHPMVRSYFQASRPDRPKSVDDNYRQESASRGLGDE